MKTTYFSLQRGLVASVIIGAIVLIGTWAYERNGKEYETAQDFVSSSQVLIAKYGKVEAVSIVPFSLSLTSTPQSGEASLKLNIRTRSASGIAYVEMFHAGGEWRVRKATYSDSKNGGEVNLMAP